MQIDKGESSAIALALETPESTVILDDYRARKIAEQLGVNYTGTIGVIIRAKIIGVIPAIKPILSKIKVKIPGILTMHSGDVDHPLGVGAAPAL